MIVQYRPVMETVGDRDAGTMLCQLLYWADKTTLPDHWIAKSLKDMMYELYFTRYAVEGAREKLVEMGFIEVKIAEFHGRSTHHYRLKIDVIDAAVRKHIEERRKFYEDRRAAKKNHNTGGNTPGSATAEDEEDLIPDYAVPDIAIEIAASPEDESVSEVTRETPPAIVENNTVLTKNTGLTKNTLSAKTENFQEAEHTSLRSGGKKREVGNALLEVMAEADICSPLKGFQDDPQDSQAEEVFLESTPLVKKITENDCEDHQAESDAFLAELRARKPQGPSVKAPHTAEELKARTRAAINTFEAKGGPDLRGIPEDLWDLARVFIQKFGRGPTAKERGYWIMSWKEQKTMKITPEDICQAFWDMSREGMWVKSPESLTTKAWNIHRCNPHNAAEIQANLRSMGLSGSAV